MAQVLPFKAVRPATDKAKHIIAQPYESYTPAELSNILADNPYSFLQIIRAGTTSNSQNIPVEKRFDHIRNTYKKFKQQQYYQKETTPCYYIYKTTNNHGTFTGVIAKTSTQEYGDSIIRKHEEIINSRKKNFAEYLGQVGFNADPVLLTYPDNTNINSLITKIVATIATYDFTNQNNERHQLWIVDTPQTIAQLTTAFAKIPKLYIADGHHRCASSYELAQIKKQQTKKHSIDTTHNYFMSYLLPESQLKIYEFNRLITDLNKHTTKQILSKISEYFHIENLETQAPITPNTNTAFTMYLEGSFYYLSLKKDLYSFTDLLSTLAPQILNKTILEPILGITDTRKDPRVQFFYAKEGLSSIKKHLHTEPKYIGFGMQPVSIEALKAIADADLKMPPKSTYVVPKLPSGFLLYEF